MNTLARVNFAGAAAVSLPAGALGKQIIVKDVSGNASANPITVSGGTIDGAANHIISTNYGSATFICASTGSDVWDVVYNELQRKEFSIQHRPDFRPRAGVDCRPMGASISTVR